MTRHDNVDAAALAGCDSSLLRSTQLAGGDVMPPQVSWGFGSGPGAGRRRQLQREWSFGLLS